MEIWMLISLGCFAVACLFNFVGDNAQDEKIKTLETELADLKTYLDQLEKDVDDELEDLNTFINEETGKTNEQFREVNNAVRNLVSSQGKLNEKLGGLRVTWEERKKA